MSKDVPKTVMPMISVDSVDALRSFYVEKLGFSHMMGVVGKDGQFDFCTVVRDGAKVMLMRPQEPVAGAAPSGAKRPMEIYLEVADVDGLHDAVRAKGVKITLPLETKWWGDRTFAVMDPYGYQIWFYQTVAEPKPPQGTKVV
jgi:PhnB protein